jgi:glutamate carboxypeptidase
MSLAVVRDHVHARRPEYLSLLEALVGTETPTGDAEGGARLLARVRHELELDGWALTVTRRERVGDVLVARLAGGSGPSTLLLAHYDTVHPVGTLARAPWREDGDVVTGPGVLDMKAGIAAAVLATRALATLGHPLRGPVTLLLTSDEESGSHESRAAIEAEALRHDRVLVLEPSRDDGALKVARKGVGLYRLHFQGRASHAGLAPEAGASALIELAHAALYAAGLAAPDLGTTVSPTVAQAGTVTNVVAERAELAIDVRAQTIAEAERVDAALRSYAPRDARVAVRVEGGVNRPPMEATPANRALVDSAAAIASPWGWHVEAALVGGGSDGNFTSALGVPTLDGIGALGGGAHTVDEHVRVTPTLDRVALLAALLAATDVDAPTAARAATTAGARG